MTWLRFTRSHRRRRQHAACYAATKTKTRMPIRIWNDMRCAVGTHSHTHSMDTPSRRSQRSHRSHTQRHRGVYDEYGLCAGQTRRMDSLLGTLSTHRAFDAIVQRKNGTPEETTSHLAIGRHIANSMLRAILRFDRDQAVQKSVYTHRCRSLWSRYTRCDRLRALGFWLWTTLCLRLSHIRNDAQRDARKYRHRHRHKHCVRSVHTLWVLGNATTTWQKTLGEYGVDEKHEHG